MPTCSPFRAAVSAPGVRPLTIWISRMFEHDRVDGKRVRVPRPQLGPTRAMNVAPSDAAGSSV